jgi:regulator of protease activity HflC (stomatin/prohibitin superfamily)
MPILLIFIFVLLFGGSFLWAKKLTSLRRQSSTAYMISVVLMVISFVGMIFIPAGIKTIETGEIAVVKVWGEVKDIKTPGLHFSNIISEKYEVYDVKTQQVDTVFMAYSLDAQVLTVEMSIQFSINVEDVVDIASTYGNLEMLKLRIEKITEERAKVLLASKSAMTLIETRGSLSADLLTSVKAIENNYYITTSAVIIVDLSFNDAFEAAVESKMIAEQEKLKAEYDKEKAIIKAEEELAVAIKAAEAALETAKGQALSIKELADAQAYALQMVQDVWVAIDADTRATMLKEIFYNKWDGVLPNVVGSDISVLFPMP